MAAEQDLTTRLAMSLEEIINLNQNTQTMEAVMAAAQKPRKGNPKLVVEGVAELDDFHLVWEHFQIDDEDGKVGAGNGNADILRISAERKPTKELYLVDVHSHQVHDLTSGLLEDLKALIGFLNDAFQPQSEPSAFGSSSITVISSVSTSLLKLDLKYTTKYKIFTFQLALERQLLEENSRFDKAARDLHTRLTKLEQELVHHRHQSRSIVHRLHSILRVDGSFDTLVQIILFLLERMVFCESLGRNNVGNLDVASGVQQPFRHGGLNLVLTFVPHRSFITDKNNPRTWKVDSNRHSATIASDCFPCLSTKEGRKELLNELQALGLEAVLNNNSITVSLS